MALTRASKPNPNWIAAMRSDDLDNCRHQAAAYLTTRGKPGFDEQKLHDMVNGCALRQELCRIDLKPAEEKILRELMAKERPDLWS
jgi:hypothetical protein